MDVTSESSSGFPWCGLEQKCFEEEVKWSIGNAVYEKIVLLLQDDILFCIQGYKICCVILSLEETWIPCDLCEWFPKWFCRGYLHAELCMF